MEQAVSEAIAQQNHWSERGRATSVANPDALGRPRRSVRSFGGFTSMKTLIHFGMRRTITGWMLFIAGLMLLSWLHTFRDSVAHSAILPLILLLWIVLAVAIWDGCKDTTLRVRLTLLFVQGFIALAASAFFFQHLLHTSV